MYCYETFECEVGLGQQQSSLILLRLPINLSVVHNLSRFFQMGVVQKATTTGKILISHNLSAEPYFKRPAASVLKFSINNRSKRIVL